LDGTLLWKRDFGLINSSWHVVESAEWEFCSSPVIFKDKVVIQADALNTAFVAVLDLHTGKTLWKQDRDEISGWCTPNIYFDDDKARVAVNGYKHRGGYVFLCLLRWFGKTWCILIVPMADILR
jgi:outer membrane protein assembly factor BamB